MNVTYCGFITPKLAFFSCVFCCLLFVNVYLVYSTIVAGSKCIAQYRRYDHKRVGQLVHCYAAQYDTNSEYYVFRTYSYQYQMGTNHNCTLVGHTHYGSRFGAKQAAKRVPLGSMHSFYVANDAPNVCIDEFTRQLKYDCGITNLAVPVFYGGIILFFILWMRWGMWRRKRKLAKVTPAAEAIVAAEEAVENGAAVDGDIEHEQEELQEQLQGHENAANEEGLEQEQEQDWITDAV